MGDDATEGATVGKYGVRLSEGRSCSSPPHPEECDEGSFLEYAAGLRDQGYRLAADLFSGAGGLSLGLEMAGYRVVMGIDRDREATETHRHHFGGLTLSWALGPQAHRPRRSAHQGCRGRAPRRRAALPAVLSGRAQQDPAPRPQRL